MPSHRVDAYLAQLPDGLDSFSECLAKASIHRKVHEFSGKALHGLTPRLQSLLDAPPPPSTRINQCEALALILAIVESQGLDPPAEKLWIRRAAKHLFESKMYQLLMWAASPSLVVKSANIRWSAFFVGTELRSTVIGREGVVTLVAPWRMFTRDLAEVFVHVMFSALNGNRDEADSASISLERFDRDAITYRVRW